MQNKEEDSEQTRKKLGVTADEIERYNLRIYPKMRSIFSISLFVLSGLSVSSAQIVELGGVEGQSMSFPAAVKQTGTLTYGIKDAKPIVDVAAGEFHSLKERVKWNHQTGLFSIDGLKKEDSGKYTVLNNDAAKQETYQYQLTVQIQASTPLVKVTRDEPLCAILCTVERGTEVTLTWYRDGQRYGSSPVSSAPNAYLPETVERGGVYTCEARNRISKQTATLTLGEHCTVPSPWTVLEVCAIVYFGLNVAVALGCAILVCAGFVTTDEGLWKVVVCCACTTVIFGVFGLMACVKPTFRKYVLRQSKGEKKEPENQHLEDKG